ncbi:MAG TPA: TonB family protein [Stenotrophobium sp.]|jgi:protein TonB|nr:TonB family protein [Stenotrophobium sp.]
MTTARTRGRWSLAIAVILHALLFLMLATIALPQLEAGAGGDGVGLEDAAGNADYDQAAALDLPPLPSPPDLPAPPAPQSPAIAQKAVIDKPVSAPESLHMQMRPGGVADGDVFLARVRAHLAHYRQALPPDLRTARGTTLLRFTVDADGAVHAASVAASSGNAALDRQAMALLQRAQPLPHRAGAITLTVPVEFGAGAAD